MNAVERNKENLRKIRDAGIPWIRMDVKKPVTDCEYLFKEAHNLGLYIIAPITSKGMLKGYGFGKRFYFRNSGWEEKWKNHIEESVEKLHDYVEIWQIDNELNHPWHNTLPFLNKQLAVDIIKIGIEAVKNIDSQAKIAVNLFHELRGPLGFPYVRDEALIRRFREEMGDSIDVLGTDIYRGSWHRGSPVQYPEDLERIHNLWQGDVMIMETGFCTGRLRGSPSDQAQHVRQVFQALENHLTNVAWFLGIMWYVYASSHAKVFCENYFGLHKGDDMEEKPAWAVFVDEVNRLNATGKKLGIMYHY